MGRVADIRTWDPDLDEPVVEGPHGHQASLSDGLAFVNTLEIDRGKSQEHLPDVEVALRWFQRRRLMHPETMEEGVAAFRADPDAAERAIARIRRVRAAMRELAEATVERRAPDPKQLDRINRALRTPYTYVLVPTPDGRGWDHKHEGDPVEGALARLVESIAREISQGHPERMRVCANEECRWVFHDTSRSGRRKWCDMATCGNRAKVARHREKSRRVELAGADAGDSPTDEVAASG